MKRSIALVLILILFLSACGTRDETDEQELKRYLSLTEKASRSFEYEAVEGGRIKTAVDGEIEDDLRNSLVWSEDGQQILERKIIDDALAVRVITPAKLEVLASGPVGGSVIVGDALRSGRWVLDPSGAPPIVSRVSDPRRRTIGLDPPTDAVEIFKYLRRSIEESLGVFEFNKDSPNYRPDLDPFPHPRANLGIKRFDLLRTTLPGRSSGGQRLPGVGSFRKMSFYVRNQRLVEVREEIDIDKHERFVEAVGDPKKAYLLEMKKAVKEKRGQFPVNERTMIFRFSRVGSSIKIGPPTDNVLTASLSGFLTQPSGAAAEGSPGEGTADDSGSPPPSDPNTATGSPPPAP